MAIPQLDMTFGILIETIQISTTDIRQDYRVSQENVKLRRRKKQYTCLLPIAHYLECSELYETMFKPEVVWMVDHQLPACSWMNVHNADCGHGFVLRY